MEPARQTIFALAELVPGAPVLPALAPTLGEGAAAQTLFQRIPAEDWRGAIRLAVEGETPEAILVPHHWRAIEKFAPAGYVERLVASARARQLPIVVVSYGDDHRPIPLPAVVFRPSMYRSQRRENEIAMPAYVEDVGCGAVSAPAWAARPSVGFVGRAGWSGLRDLLAYLSRTVLARHPFKDGRYYRRTFAAALAKDARVDCRFLFRRRYSGHRASIELSPEDARREYLENARAATYGLAPKGDGNYSLRFYELLALGRLPILPDTGMVLPLEDVVRYRDFVVDVSSARRAAAALVAWHEERGAAGLAEASRAARAAFERYLYAPRFFAVATEAARLAPWLARARRELLG